MKEANQDRDEYMQIVRDTWLENETERRIRRNGAYPKGDDDFGGWEPFVWPQVWINEGIAQ